MGKGSVFFSHRMNFVRKGDEKEERMGMVTLPRYKPTEQFLLAREVLSLQYENPISCLNPMSLELAITLIRQIRT